MKKRLIILLLITNLAVSAATTETKVQIDFMLNYIVLCQDGQTEISGYLILQSDMLQTAFNWALQHKKPFALSETNQDILTLLNDLNNNRSDILEINDITILTSLLNFTFYLQIDLNNNLFQSLLHQFIKIFHTLDIPMKHEAYNDLIPNIQESVTHKYLLTYHVKDIKDLLANNIASYKLFKELDHDGTDTSVAITSDNSVIVTGSNDKKARIWDAQTGQLLHTLDHKYRFNTLTIPSNNIFTVAISGDNKSRIWNTQTGEMVTTLNYNKSILSVSISFDNNFIATDSYDKKAIIWNTQTGELFQTLEHDNRVKSIAISSDNNFIVTGSHGKARIWDAQTGKLLQTLNHNGTVTSVVISSNNNFIVTGSNDNKAIIWKFKLDFNPIDIFRKLIIPEEVK